MPEPIQAAPKAETPARTFMAEVTENITVAADYMLVTLMPERGSAPPPPEPGQFYMVASGAYPEPLLKRPFCFFAPDGSGFKLLYRIKGKGTRLMSQMKPGAKLEVLGPLGNSYPMPAKNHRPIIVAGGVGIASVMPLLAALGKRATVVYGARKSTDLVFHDYVQAICGSLHVATDDGSYGTRGTVADALRKMDLGKTDTLYTCGPRPMMAAVAEVAACASVKGFASLEEYMACGIGACMGCVARTRQGYRRVCKEGPVFRLEEVIF